jgi:hypothetical protein
MIVALHWFLALTSALLVASVGIEAGVRAGRNRPPGTLAARLSGLMLLVLGLAAAGGLGLFVGGSRPHEELHLLYGALAFAPVPVVNAFSGRASIRGRALATALAALIGLVVILRLFMTG